jgi:hypothetical protein
MFYEIYAHHSVESLATKPWRIIRPQPDLGHFETVKEFASLTSPSKHPQVSAGRL